VASPHMAGTTTFLGHSGRGSGSGSTRNVLDEVTPRDDAVGRVQGASPTPSVTYDLVDADSRRGSPGLALDAETGVTNEWRKAFTRDPEFAFKVGVPAAGCCLPPPPPFFF